MTLEYLTDEQKDLLERFLTALDNKSKLAKFAGIKTFDTAYPQGRADAIRNIMPEFNGAFMVYNYDDCKAWGEFSNVAEKSIQTLYRELYER